MTGLVCQSFSRLNTEDRTSCPPSIAVESCEALLGRTGSITAVVHGVPKPHVTWHRHLGKLHTDRKYRVLSRDHVCCLRLRRVELADAGEYLCVATNPSGRETTQVILQVKDPPPIMTSESSPRSAFKTFGDGDKPETEVKKTPFGVLRKIITRGTPLLRRQDAQDQESPLFERDLSDQEAEEGREARFRCVVSGYPEPSVTWRKDGRDVTHNRNYITERDGRGGCSLVVPTVTREDQGEFCCVAKNEAGKARSSGRLKVKPQAGSMMPNAFDTDITRVLSRMQAASLSTQEVDPVDAKAPRFDRKITDTEAREGGRAKFRCKVTGNPPPQVLWYKNGQPIPTNSNKYVTIHDADGTCALLVLKVDDDDDAEYVCKATNCAGATVCSAELIVELASDGRDTDTEESTPMRRSPISAFHPLSPRRTPLPSRGPPLPTITPVEAGYEASMDSSAAQDSDIADELIFPVILETGPFVSVQEPTDSSSLSRPDSASSAASLNTLVIRKTSPSPSEYSHRLSPLGLRDTSDSVVSTDTLAVRGKGSTKSSRSPSPKSRHRLSPKAFSDLDERKLVRRKSSTRSGLDSPSPKQISPRQRRRYSTSSSPPFKKHLSPKTRRRSSRSSKSSRSPSPSLRQFSPRLMRRSLQELDSSSSDSTLTSPQRSPKLRRRSRKLSRSPSPSRRHRSPQPVTQDVEGTMQAWSRTNSPGHRRSPKPVVGIEIQESRTGGRRSREASRRGSLSPTTFPLLENAVLTSTPITKDGFLSPMHGLSRTTSPSEAPPVPTIGVAVAGGRRLSAASSRSGSGGVSPTPSIEIEVSESKTGGRRSRASSSASSRAMSPAPSIEIEIIPRSRASSFASSRGISPTPSLEVEVAESRTGGRRSRASSGGASPSPSIILDEFETVEEEPDLEKGPDFAKDPEFHFLRVPPRLSFGGHSRPSSSEYETPDEEPSERHEQTGPGKLQLPKPLAAPEREGFHPSGRRNLEVQTAEFTEPLKNLSVNEGSEVRLDCRVTGLPKPTVFWFKDGSEVRPLRLGAEIRAQEDLHTLYIPVADSSHEGVYMCRTENAAGVATCSSMLHVQGAPRSTSSGEEHVSSCISSFSPMTNTSGSSTCENLTDHASETNSAEGWCTPEQLSDVEGSPEFIKELESLHAVQGSAVIFECEVTGSPAPAVSWYKDGQPLVEDGDHIHYESRDDGTFLLTIIDVQNQDVGTYTCRASNTVGDVVTHADLLVSVASSSRTTSVSSYKASGLDELPSGQSFDSLGTSKEDPEEVQILELLPAVGPDVLHLRRGTTPPRPASRPDSTASTDSNPVKRLRLEHDFVSDSSETESTLSEQYTVVSDYTPADSEQDRVPLKEGQMVEVLDSSSPDLWLVRTIPSPPEPAQGWVPPSFLQTLTHSPSTRKGKSQDASQDTEKLKERPRRGSKEMEASSKRRFVLEELLRTEGDYVRDLKFVADHYISMFDSHSLPYLLRGKREVIFMNIEQIYDFHSSIFIHELGTCKDEPSKVGKIFVKWQHKFDMHVEYCKNKQRSETLLSTSAARNFFDDYTKRSDERKLTLSDYLIKPVQRITKYQLLLKELVKYTTRAKLDSTDLEHALGVMMDVPKRANDLLHISMIDGFYGNHQNIGKLLRQDSFMVWDSRTAKGRGKERHIFLFNNMVLFTKRKRNSLDSIEYSYKGLMRLPGIGVTEDVEGDSRKFEMWYGKPDSSERYTVQAKTIYVKQAWVKEIRDILDKHTQEAQDVKSAVEARISAMESTSSLGSSIDTPSTPTTPSSAGSRQRHVSGPNHRRRGSNVFSETSFDSLIHTAETLAVGGLYEVLETVIVDGTDELELHKGEQVKVIRSAGDDFYLVEPLTEKGELAGERGWVPGYLLKKTGEKEKADDAAHFVTPLRDLTHREGETATFSCQFAGTKPLAVSWLHDGVTVETGDRLSVITTATQSSLLIGRTVLADVGRYECVISNEAGTETSLAELDVRENILPKLEHLDFVSVEEGDTAELWVGFSGSPKPQFRWTREDKHLNICEKFSIREDENRTCLTVNDADLEDAGEYTCEVTNVAGTAIGAVRLNVVKVINEELINEELISEDSDDFTSDSYDSSDNEMETNEESWEDEVFPPEGYDEHDNNNKEHQQQTTFGNSLDLLKLGHVCVQKDTQISDVYEVKDKLGQGRFGTVYLCEDKTTRRRFAAKYVRCRRSADRQSINHEIEIMNQLRHPRILQLYDAFDCGKEVAMIMELITGGELFQLVADEAVELSEKACVSYVRQLCEAVSYMHEQNILHLDLKPENIMCISKKGTAIKLIDFGLARKFDPKADNRVMFGTPEFVAPEVINFDSIDYSTDMWSIGVITYVLLSGLSPFMGDTDQETLANVTLAEFDFDDEAFDNISDDAKNFIEQLLLKDKESRHTAKSALQHCWLAQDNTKVRNEKIKTDKLRRWWLKRKWQKAGNAIRAVGRFRRSLGLLSGSVSEGSTSSPNGSTSTEEN
ncbi:obscurin-like [Branchiostoma floridae x Branchiostoma belcheri]